MCFSCILFMYFAHVNLCPFSHPLGVRCWMDVLGFYFPSTVFQSFRDDGRVNMKGSVQ